MKYLAFALIGVLLSSCWGIRTTYWRIRSDKKSWYLGQKIDNNPDTKNLQDLLFHYYSDHKSWPSTALLDSVKAWSSLKNFKSIEILQSGDTAKVKFRIEYEEPLDPMNGFKLLEGKMSLIVKMESWSTYNLHYNRVVLNNNLEPQWKNRKYVTTDDREFKKWAKKYLRYP